MDAKASHAATQLPGYGLLSCAGVDARAFLHAQLTSDVAALAPDRARLAGWCSAKGRLLATFLVVPRETEFLMQLPRALAPAVARRLAMFVLRSKVELFDASDAWLQFGIWGAAASERLAKLGLTAPRGELQSSESGGCIVVQVAPQRFLVLAPASARERFASLVADVNEDAWALEEIRDGRAQVLPQTQEQFVPQMINLDRRGGVDFHKGCYPGQEVVARTQYRGVLKRRMVRARAGAAAVPGDELFAEADPGQPSGMVVNAASAPEGGTELLAVVQISAIESARPIRLRTPDGPALELLPLPYA